MLRYMIAIPCLLASSLVVAQGKYVPVEQRLTPDQMRETGLDRLTSAQLDLLNRLLEADRATAVSVARAEASKRPERQPVEGRIRGTFRGWQVGQVVTLEDGQRWRVTEGDMTTRAIESPMASIRPGLVSGWYLRVEGQTPVAKVTPID
jgi:hypothetical protein